MATAINIETPKIVVLYDDPETEEAARPFGEIAQRCLADIAEELVKYTNQHIMAQGRPIRLTVV